MAPRDFQNQVVYHMYFMPVFEKTPNAEIVCYRQSPRGGTCSGWIKLWRGTFLTLFYFTLTHVSKLSLLFFNTHDCYGYDKQCFSQQVARRLGVHKNTVGSLMRKWRQTGSVEDRHRRPKPRVTTIRQDRLIVLSHLRDRKKTATETARATLGRHGRPISRYTVRRRLKAANGGSIRAHRPFRGLILTLRHRRQRLQWARRHLRWNRAQWATVLFTDEKRFKLYNSDGRKRIYRRRGERFSDPCVIRTDHYGGGSIMVWAGMSLLMKTPLVVINGNLTARKYQTDVLNPVVVPIVRQNRNTVLMQDGAPPHTARTTTALIRNNRINVLDWPSKSPDLNPIENVWSQLSRKVYQNQPQNLQHLRQIIINEWNNLPQRFFRNFVMSMRARCQACVRANGGYTRY